MGGALPLLRGSYSSRSNTMLPGTRPTYMLSGNLIHPTV